ncbi:MAG: ribosomal protein L7/L12 [Victivallales bacterium]|nr:ribosomal protein L7/L12 [Victivallales bacterium]
MTQPHSDNDFNNSAGPYATQPHSDDGGTVGAYATQPHSDEDDAYASGSSMLPPGGLPLLDGKYLAQKRLAGGMGVVYKCVKRATGEVVALKTVLSDGPMTAEDIKSMRRNYGRVHALSHDHIVRVNALEVDERNGQWYVEMDWVEGESLEGRHGQFGGDMMLVARDAVRVLRQVAEALDYAHGRGVVHRDVKEANIMIEKATGNVVLIDFGIAGRAPHAAGANGTLPHEVTATATVSAFAGTRGYQSPEQWLGKPVEIASDEYSLAVTAYHCLSGHLPFWSANEGLLQEMVLNDDMPPVKSLPDVANAVLKKALAKKPSERYESCKAFIDALEKGLSSLMGGAGQPQKTVGSQPSNGGEAAFTTADFYILASKMEDCVAECEKREWDRGQTFGEHLDMFKRVCKSAKMAASNKDYSAAYSLYKQAEEEWRWLEESEPLRKSAADCRIITENAREAAVTADAEHLEKEDFQAAVNLLNTGDGHFASGRFEEAKKSFSEAGEAFKNIAKASRIKALKARIKGAYDAKRLDEARRAVDELRNLDDAVATQMEKEGDTAVLREKAALKTKRVNELEAAIKEAMKGGRFGDARRKNVELKQMDATKAAQLEAAIRAAEAADEVAKKSKRVEELESAIRNDVRGGSFDHARQLVEEVGKLDAAKAVSLGMFIDEKEKSRKDEKVGALEKAIETAMDSNRFQDAYQAIGKLMELDVAKATSWRDVIDDLYCTVGLGAGRIPKLKESITKDVEAGCFEKARQSLATLKKLDAEGAAQLETFIDNKEKSWRKEQINALEKSIETAMDSNRFQDAYQAIGKLMELDVAKATSWREVIDELANSDRETEQISELKTAIAKAIAAGKFQDARQSLDELKTLDVAGAAQLEEEIDSAEANWAARRVEVLEAVIREAIDEWRFMDARRAVDEMKRLDEEKAASWEAEITKQEASETEAETKTNAEAGGQTEGKTGDKTNKFNKLLIIIIRFVISLGISFALSFLLSMGGCGCRDSSKTNKTQISPAAREHLVELLKNSKDEKKSSVSEVVKPSIRRDGESYIVTLKPDVEIKLIMVKAGSFMMGSEEGGIDEKPVHQVTLTKDFWLGETEVTQAQWKAVMQGVEDDEGNEFNFDLSYFKGDTLPVERVLLEDVAAFCDQLNHQFKNMLPKHYLFDLPTEAQWEYAARGGHKSQECKYKYSGSDNLDEIGWYLENSGEEHLDEKGNTLLFSEESIAKTLESNKIMTHPVGMRKPNILGLYDMSGNVSEWCNDWYGIYLPSPIIDPIGSNYGWRRVVRGGSWNQTAGCSRLAFRTCLDASLRFSNVGFRLALVPIDTPPKVQKGATVYKEETYGSYDVFLVDGGSNKIRVIKEIRYVTGLGLREAKVLVYEPEVSKLVKADIHKDEADEIKKILEAVGARVEIKKITP